MTKENDFCAKVEWPQEVERAFKKNCDVLVRRVKKDGIITYKFFALQPDPIARQINISEDDERIS